jgi:chromosome segregation ATPase
MRISTKRLAMPVAVLAALAVGAPASSLAQPTTDQGATAAQRSKDPRDRKGDKQDPRCRIVQRQVETAAARIDTAQNKVAAASQKLNDAKAAAKAATGKRAKAKAAAKVKKAKKAVKRAKKKVKQAKADLREANADAERFGCGG